MQMHFRPKQRAPNELGGVKIPYVGTRGKRHKIAWYLILFAVLSPILLLLSGVVGSWLTLTANGTVFLEQQEIRAARAGRISRLSVAAGDVVAAGETLAALDNLELDAAAARNAVERQAAGAAGRSVSAQQQSATEELRVRERLLRYQQNRRVTIANLVREGAATVAELTAAESAAAEAEVGLLQTRAAAARAPGVNTAEVDHVDRSGADRQPARGRLRLSEVRQPAETRHDSNDPFSGRNADSGAHSGAADTHAAHACGPRGPVRAAPDDGGTESPAEGEAERQPAGSGATGIGALPLRLGVVRDRGGCWGNAR